MVTIQGMCLYEEALYSAEEFIKKTCEGGEVTCSKAWGPDYDKKFSQVSYGRY